MAVSQKSGRKKQRSYAKVFHVGVYKDAAVRVACRQEKPHFRGAWLCSATVTTL